MNDDDGDFFVGARNALEIEGLIALAIMVALAWFLCEGILP